MYTTVEITYDGRVQIALVEWNWVSGKPAMTKVLIGLEDVTEKLGYMAKSKIKIAVAEAAKMRATV